MVSVDVNDDKSVTVSASASAGNGRDGIIVQELIKLIHRNDTDYLVKRDAFACLLHAFTRHYHYHYSYSQSTGGSTTCTTAAAIAS
jgi:hypothetical protein